MAMPGYRWPPVPPPAMRTRISASAILLGRWWRGWVRGPLRGWVGGRAPLAGRADLDHQAWLALGALVGVTPAGGTPAPPGQIPGFGVARRDVRQHTGHEQAH